MTPLTFINKIKQIVYDSAVNGSVSLLKEPPGKNPSFNLITLSNWFNHLTEEDKKMIYSIVELVARQTSFGMLAVLDGVRQIDDHEENGVLELRYIKDEQSLLLNDPNGDYLHDLFNQQVPPA